MGTHFYLVEVSKRESGKYPDLDSIVLRKVNPRSTENVEIFCVSGSKSNFLRNHGCREALTNAASIYFPIMKEHFSKFNFLFAFRCFGEQYTSVANQMVRYGDSEEKLSEFLSEIFEMRISLDYGKISEEAYKTAGLGHYKKSYINSKGKEGYKLSNAYITIYIKSWEQERFRHFPVKMSAITGILREPKIVKEILRGNIQTRLDLCKALTDLAALRLEGKDRSYFCLTLAGKRSYHAAWNSLFEMLQHPFNFDGSDWMSLTNLACFIFHANHKSLPNNHGNNGVSSYVNSDFGVEYWERFKEGFSSPTVRESLRIARALRDASNWIHNSAMTVGLK